jgi:acetyl-CoA carboxylase biotin carboxyl carrier protein
MAKKSNPSSKGSLSSQSTGSVDLSHLERMLAFMELHGLEEFEYEHAGLRVRLRKPSANAQHASAPSARFMAMPAAAHAENFEDSPALSSSAASASQSPGSTPPAQAVESEDLHLVKSPIVGTFYECPTPGAPPFVKPGDQVTAGQVLCIIEAMKLMNEIESDAAGEVVRRFVENGQPVEYGESLFAIRTSRKK